MEMKPPPVVKNKQPLVEKKVPPIEKKKSPPVLKKQPEMEPEKKGCYPWITKFWKVKEVPDGDILAHANYVERRTYGFYDEVEFDRYTALNAEQEGYNP